MNVVVCSWCYHELKGKLVEAEEVMPEMKLRSGRVPEAGICQQHFKKLYPDGLFEIKPERNERKRDYERERRMRKKLQEAKAAGDPVHLGRPPKEHSPKERIPASSKRFQAISKVPVLSSTDGLLSLKEAAKTYHVPFYTLQSASKTAIEPIGRVGLAYYYQPKTVENYLKEKQLI